MSVNNFPFWKKLSGILVLPLMAIGIIYIPIGIKESITQIQSRGISEVGPTLFAYVIFLILFIYPGYSWIKAYKKAKNESTNENLPPSSRP